MADIIAVPAILASIVVLQPDVTMLRGWTYCYDQLPLTAVAIVAVVVAVVVVEVVLVLVVVVVVVVVLVVLVVLI